MSTRRFLAVLLCAAALASCDKNGVQSITEAATGGSFIKYFNFGVNAPSVVFYANDVKVTAIGASGGVESTSGTAYGGAGAGGYYTDIAPGQYTIKPKITATTDKGLAIANISVNLVAGKQYSFYMSGFYDTGAKTIDGFLVEDALPDYDWNQAYVRFVNASSNSQPMTLYAKNTSTSAEVAIGSAVAYKAAGAFVPVPATTYDLALRLAGSSTNTVSRTAVAFGAGKVYTITLRGDMTVSSSSATNRPFLDNTANR